MIVCLFDIDGTLLRSGGAGKAAMEAALATAFGVPASAEDVPFSGRTDRAIARDLFQIHDVLDSPENFRRFVTAYLSHLPQFLARTNGLVLPGIAELLVSLTERDDVAVGLLTGNLREGARIKLGHYELYHHFRFGGFGDIHLNRNDVARDALAAVQQHLEGGIEPGRIWVVGDTPLDVQCARSIGARAVAVATGWHTLDILRENDPDLLLEDLSDPAPLLALWE